MQQPDHLERNVEPEHPGVRGRGSALASHTRLAINRLDIAECIRIVAWANEHPSRRATSVLGILTEKPRHGKAKRAWDQQQWVEMRVTAIEALRRTNSGMAAPALVNSLMYESGNVRALAKDALEEIGERAAPYILHSIETCRDWPLHGMLETIDSLSNVQHAAVRPVLTRVLLGNLPRTTHRWSSCLMCWSAMVGLSVGAFFGLLGIMLAGQLPEWYDVFYIVAGAMIVATLSSIAAAPVVGLVITRLRSQESVKLKTAAANAIILV